MSDFGQFHSDPVPEGDTSEKLSPRMQTMQALGEARVAFEQLPEDEKYMSVGLILFHYTIGLENTEKRLATAKKAPKSQPFLPDIRSEQIKVQAARNALSLLSHGLHNRIHESMKVMSLEWMADHVSRTLVLIDHNFLLGEPVQNESHINEVTAFLWLMDQIEPPAQEAQRIF